MLFSGQMLFAVMFHEDLTLSVGLSFRPVECSIKCSMKTISTPERKDIIVQLNSINEVSGELIITRWIENQSSSMNMSVD